MSFLETVPEVRHPAPGVALLCAPESRYKRALCELHFDRPLDRPAPARTLLCPILEQGTRRHPTRMHLTRALEDLYGASAHFDSDRVAEMQRVSLELSWVGERFLPPADAGGGRVAAGILSLAMELLEDPVRGAGAPFPAETFARERDQLLRRIRSLRDDRQAYATERFLALLCAGEPLGRPPYGTEEEVLALTAEDVEAARRELLEQAPVTAVAVGPLDPAQIERHLASWLGAGGAHAGARRAALPPPVLVTPQRLREEREDLPVDQARFFFGFRFHPPAGPEELEALTLANGVLGGGAHGRLFRRVREERSLAYGIYSTIRAKKGILTVEAGIDAGAYEEVRDEVLAQVELMARGAFEDAELEMARANVLNDLHGLQDSAAALSHFYTRELNLGFLRAPAQRAAQLQRVRRDEVAAAAAGWQADLVYLLAGTRQPVEVA